MKRDLELIRTILLTIEGQPSGPPIFGVTVEGKSEPEVLEHIALLIEAGLVSGQIQEGNSSEPVGCVIFRLTWAGHEFLADARNETVWKKVTATITGKVGTVSLEVLKQLLAKAAADLLT